MKTLCIFLSLLVLAGCQTDEEIEAKRAELIKNRETRLKNEQEIRDYVESLPLESKVYMKACLDRMNKVDTCITDMKQLGAPKKEEELSTTDIAIGTGLGYGAAKILLDK